MKPELATMMKNNEMTAGELYLDDEELLFVGNNPDAVIPGKAALYSKLTKIPFDKIAVADEWQGCLGIISEEQEVTMFSMKNAETVALWLDAIMERLDPNKTIRYLKTGYLNKRTEKSMILLLKVLRRCRLFVLCSKEPGDMPILIDGSDNQLYAMAYTEKKVPERFLEKFRIREMPGEDLLVFVKKIQEWNFSPWDKVGGFFLDRDTETAVCVNYDSFK